MGGGEAGLGRVPGLEEPGDLVDVVLVDSARRPLPAEAAAEVERAGLGQATKLSSLTVTCEAGGPATANCGTVRAATVNASTATFLRLRILGSPSMSLLPC